MSAYKYEVRVDIFLFLPSELSLHSSPELRQRAVEQLELSSSRNLSFIKTLESEFELHLDIRVRI